MRSAIRDVVRRIVVASVAAAAVALGAPAASAEPAATPAAAPVGFVPSSTSWLDRSQGWVLGFVPCDAGNCPVLLRTWDGGRTWLRVPAPDVAPSELNDRVRVHFADAANGLVTDGQRLYATHTGGLFWRQVELRGAQPPVFIGELASNDRSSLAVVTTGEGDQARTQLFSSPRSWSQWEPVPGVQIPGAGGGDVVAEGDSAYVVLTAVFQTTGYWVTTGGTGWQQRPAPCSVDARADLALAGTTVFALCSYNPGMGRMFKDAKVSTAGGPFEPVGSAPLEGITTGFAAASDSILVATAVGLGAAFAHRSVDGGAVWNTPFVIEEPPLYDLDFQDGGHGVMLHGGFGTTAAELYQTCDAGATWQLLPLDDTGQPCAATDR
jgi:hypothetical protein